MSRLLTYDPQQRITAEEALHHPYFKLRQFSYLYFSLTTFTIGKLLSRNTKISSARSPPLQREKSELQ